MALRPSRKSDLLDEIAKIKWPRILKFPAQNREIKVSQNMATLNSRN